MSVFKRLLGILGLRRFDTPLETGAAALTGLARLPDLPAAFGFKSTWLAVKSTDTEAVFKALELDDETVANWESGVAFAYSGGGVPNRTGVFVTPPVGDWTLVVLGLGLNADSNQSITRLRQLLGALSSQFGECQCFGNNMAVGYLAWFKAVQGELLRAFSFANKTLHINEGVAEPIEIEVISFDVSGLDQIGYWDTLEEEEQSLDEDVPMAIAALWSVNPLSLSGGKPATGLAGCMSI